MNTIRLSNFLAIFQSRGRLNQTSLFRELYLKDWLENSIGTKASSMNQWIVTIDDGPTVNTWIIDEKDGPLVWYDGIRLHCGDKRFDAVGVTIKFVYITQVFK